MDGTSEHLARWPNFIMSKGENAETKYGTRGGTVVSKHGALQCRFDGDVRIVAYEGLSGRRDAWTHGIVLCLPVHDARMDRRQVLTEIGPDSGAVRDKDRDGVLFDMGVGAEQINFCVRIRDPHLLKTLRQYIGKTIIEFDHPAAQTIIHSSPHRVCLSRLGRYEVFQRIPWKPNESSPTSPHTHVLPDLLSIAGATQPISRSQKATLPAYIFTPPTQIRTHWETQRNLRGVSLTNSRSSWVAMGLPHIWRKRSAYLTP